MASKLSLVSDVRNVNLRGGGTLGFRKAGSRAGRLLAAVLLVASAILAATPAQAATLYWNSSGGTNTLWDLNNTQDWGTVTGGPYNAVQWTDFSNWGTDTAVFQGTAGAITLNSNLSAQGLQFTVVGGGYSISGANTLTLGAGGINAGSQTGGATTISSGTLSLQGGQSWQLGSGGTLTVDGIVTRNLGATVDFSTNGTFNGTGLFNAVGATVNGWATIGGTDWAVNNGSNIAALTSYTTENAVGSWTAGQDLTNNGGGYSGTTTSDLLISSLRFNSANASTVTIGIGNTLTIASGGILETSTVAGNAQTITGGTLQGASGSDLVVIQNNTNTSGGLTIASLIANNGGATGLTKSGSGTLTLSNSNSTYSGGTTLNAGTLVIDANSTFTGSVVNSGPIGTGTLTLSGGTLTNTSGGNATIANAVVATPATNTTLLATPGGNIQLYGNITSSGTLTNGNSNYSADLGGNNSGFTGTYVHASGGATEFLSADAGSPNAAWNLTNNGGRLMANVSGTINLGSLSGVAGSFVENGANVLTTFSIGALSTSTTYAGTIMDNAGTVSVTKVGSGTLALTGANIYTGITTLTAGKINLGATETPGTSGPLGKSVAPNAGSIVLNGGYLQHSAANQNDYSGRFSTANNQQYNVDTNGRDVTWATALTSSGGSLIKTGAGTLTLSAVSTYSGPTTINGGTLKLSAPPIFVGDNGNAVTATYFGTAYSSATNTIDGSGMSNLTNGKVTKSSLAYQTTGWDTGFLASGNSGSLIYTFTNPTSLNEMVIWNLSESEDGNAYGRGMNGVTITYSTADASGVDGGTIFTGNLNQATWSSPYAGTTYNNDFTGLIATGVQAVKIAFTSNFSGNSGDYTGLSEVRFGTTNLNVANLLPTSTALTVSNGTLDLGGFNQQVASLTGNSAGSVINSGATAITLTLNPASGSTVFSGAIGGGGGGALSLTMTGNGTQVLSGNNTYTGATTINGGTLAVNGSLASGSTVGIASAAALAGSGTISGNATVTGNGIIDLASSGIISGTLSSSGGNWIGTGTVGGQITASSNTFTIGSGANLTSSSGVSVTGGTFAVNGGLANTGPLAIGSAATLTGSGTISGNATLAGNGAIDLSGGTIGGTLGATGGYWNGTGTVVGSITASANTFTLGSGANLIANAGLSVTGGTLAGAGMVSGNATLSNNAAINLSGGILGGNLLSSGGYWNGTGTVAGSITANSGLFTIASGASLAANGGLNVSGGTLCGAGTISGGTVTLGSGASIVPGATPANGSIGTLALLGLSTNGSGTLNFDLSGSTTAGGGVNDLIAVSNNLTLDGSTTVGIYQTVGTLASGSPYTLFTYGGTLTDSGSNALTLAPGTLGARQSAAFDYGSGTNSAVTLTINGLRADLTWVGTPSSTWVNSSSAAYAWTSPTSPSGDFFTNGDFVMFNNTAGATTVTLSGALSPASVTVTGTNSFTFSGNGSIQDATSLTVAGSGSLTISNTGNSYTGGTAIQDGTVVLGAGNALPTAGSVTLGLNSTNGTLNLAGFSQQVGGLAVGLNATAASQIITTSTGSPTLTYSGGVSTFYGTIQDTSGGTLNLTVSGGTLDVSGGGTIYSGATTVNGGELLAGNLLNTGGIAVDGGVLNAASYNSAALLSVASGGSAGISGTNLSLASVSNSGSISFSGNSDTITLAGLSGNGTTNFAAGAAFPNLSGGSVTVAGSLAISGSASGGTAVVTGPATIGTLNGAALTIGGITSISSASGGTANLNGPTASITTLGNAIVNLGSSTALSVSGGTQTSAGQITGAGGSLTMIGPGTLTLGGSNTYSGGTFINNGALVYGAANTLPTTGAVTIGGGTLDMESFNGSVGTVTLTGGGIIGTTGVLTGASYGVQSGSIGAILGGNGALNKTTTGTVTLSGANTYSGGTTISGGTLAVIGSGTLGASSGSLTMGGGQLDQGATSGSVGAVSITAAAASGDTIQNGSLTGTSYIANPSGNAIVSASLNGTAGVLMSGAGTLTLTGSNSYSGGTTISAGVVSVSGTGTLGSTSGSLAVNGGLVNLNGTSQGVGNFTGTGGTIANNLSATAGILIIGNGNGTGGNYQGVIADHTNGGSGTLALVKTGNGSLTLSSGSSTYSGGTTLNAGTIKIGANSTSTSGVVTSGPIGTGTLTLSGGTLTGVDGANRSIGNAIFVTPSTTTTLTSFVGGNFGLNGNITGSGTLTGNPTAYSIDLGGDNSGFTGTYNHNGNGATIFDTTTAASANAAWSATSSDKGFYTLVSGTYNFGSLSGGNSTTYLGANTGTTSTTYSIGALGTSTAFAGIIMDNFGYYFTGAGPVSVTKVGSGTLTLSGANTFSGGLTVNNGAVSFASDGSTPNTGYPLGVYPSTVKAAAVTLDGGGLLNTTSGTIAANRGITLGASGGTLDASSTKTLTVNSIIAGGGGLTKGTNSSTVTLSGNNTYSGTTTVSGGTLALVAASGNTNIGSSPTILVGDSLVHASAVLNVEGVSDGFQVTSGQTLAGHGTVTGGAVTINAGGYLSPGNSPGNSGIGTINVVGATTLGSGSYLNYDFGSGTCDLLNVTGGLTLNPMTLNFATTNLANGNYTLFTASDGFTGFHGGILVSNSGSIGNFTLGTGAPNKKYEFELSGNNVTLAVSDPYANPFYTLGISAGNSRILVNSGLTTLSSTITNTNVAIGDGINFTGLGAGTGNTGGTVVGSTSASITPLAADGSSFVNSEQTFNATTVGVYTLTASANVSGAGGSTPSLSDSAGTVNVTAVAARTVTAPASIDLGRVLTGHVFTRVSSGTIGGTFGTGTGSHADTEDATLSYSGNADANGINLNTEPTTLNTAGGTLSFSGTISGVGSKNGSFSVGVTPELSGGSSTISVGYTANPVATRTVGNNLTVLGITNPSTLDPVYHKNATFSVLSNSFSYTYGNGLTDGTSDHSNTEDASVANIVLYEGDLDTGPGFTFSSGSQSISSSLGFSGTFSGTAVQSRPADTATFNLDVTRELSVGTTKANAGFSINVYSGNMAWSSSSGDWVTGSKWDDKGFFQLADGAHVAPGLDANTAFKGTDTATFNGTNASDAVTEINLSSLNPSLATLSFSNSGYRLTSGSLTMFNSSAGSNATINVSGGTDTIDSLLFLASTTEMTVDSASRLNIIGKITGPGALVKVGSGTLVLSGTSEYEGGTVVNEGTVYQKYSTYLPSNGSLTIGAGAKFIYDPSVTIAGPFIMAGPVSFLTSPAFASPVSMNSPLNPVPEPSTLALLVAGVVVGFGAWRRRRK